jgi:FkbM family methyltransferase
MPSTDPTTHLAPTLRLLAQIIRSVPRPIRHVFSRAPILGGALQRLLERSAPEAPTEVAVESGLLRGTRLRLNLRVERDYWLGTYERQLMAAIADFCRAGMVVYDLGANIGYTALAFAHAVGRTGRVYAFEPLPDNTRRIVEHVALNGLQEVVQLVPCAVSDHEGFERFDIHYSHLQGRIAAPTEGDTQGEQSEVPSISLDDFVYQRGNPPPDAIKIDIEGGATKAFPGMVHVLEAKRPIIFLEIHNAAEQQIAWDMLERYGYQMRLLRPGYPRLGSREELAEGWPHQTLALPE